MTEPLPEYGRPPLDEVAAGVQFAPVPIRLVDVAAIHGLFIADYPLAMDQPPLMPMFETFGPAQARPFPLSLPFFAGPPWRVWFVSANDEHVIQFQVDRLLANWRIRRNDQSYPRFPEVWRRFFTAFDLVAQYVASHGMGAIQVNQCELTYFNKISLRDHETFADVSRFIRGIDLTGATRPGAGFTDGSFTASRILTEPLLLPWGRLGVECMPAFEPDGRKSWRLNISFRGRPAGEGQEGIHTFFEIAHREIVTTFAEITTDSMHQEWERRR